MTTKQRDNMKDRFWSWVNPSLDTYSRTIESLLDTLTDKQLAEFVNDRAPEEERDDE